MASGGIQTKGCHVVVTRFPFTALANPGSCSSSAPGARWLKDVQNYKPYDVAQAQYI